MINSNADWIQNIVNDFLKSSIVRSQIQLFNSITTNNKFIIIPGAIEMRS